MSYRNRVRTPAQIKWPTDVLMWIKIFTDKYPWICDQVDYEKTSNDKMCQYMHTVTLHMQDSVELRSFDQIAHTDGWSKRGAVCAAIHWLNDSGYIETCVPLPDLDYPEQKIAEVDLLTQSAGGYNLNSAIVKVGHILRINLKTEQLDTERTIGRTKFYHCGILFESHREGRNNEETKKMVNLDICCQFLKHKIIQPRVASIHTNFDDRVSIASTTMSSLTVLEDMSDVFKKLGNTSSQNQLSATSFELNKDLLSWFQAFHFYVGKLIFTQPAEFEKSSEDKSTGYVKVTGYNTIDP